MVLRKIGHYSICFLLCLMYFTAELPDVIDTFVFFTSIPIVFAFS